MPNTIVLQVHFDGKARKMIKECQCDNSGARTVKKVFEGLWQCPRCEGLIVNKRTRPEESQATKLRELNEAEVNRVLESAHKCSGVKVRLRSVLDVVDFWKELRPILAAEICARFGIREVKVEWPEKRFGNITLADKHQCEGWNEAIDACIVAFNRAIGKGEGNAKTFGD